GQRRLRDRDRSEEDPGRRRRHPGEGRDEDAARGRRRPGDDAERQGPGELMVQAGESSIAPGRARPRSAPRPPAVTTGTVEITVNLEAICWDTFANGESGDNSDRPLENALVALSPTGGAMLTQLTGADGKARFENVPLGATPVRCAHEGYRNGDTSVTVA